MNNIISVNVLAVEGKDVYICRKGIGVDEREVNLMLVSDGDKWHYTVIKSLSRLLSSSNSKHMHKQYFCTNCLQGFTQELRQNHHQAFCENNESVKVEMPIKGSTVEFLDGQLQLRIPFMMYADFGSILEPIQGSAPDPAQPYTMNANKHVPSGWHGYSKFAYGDVNDSLKLYRGEDCIEKFCKHLKQEAYKLYHMFPEKPMTPLTNKQWKKYKKVSRCHICYKPFSQKDIKVRDHCHYTGHYRGPAHRSCNLRYQIPS